VCSGFEAPILLCSIPKMPLPLMLYPAPEKRNIKSFTKYRTEAKKKKKNPPNPPQKANLGRSNKNKN